MAQKVAVLSVLIFSLSSPPFAQAESTIPPNPCQYAAYQARVPGDPDLPLRGSGNSKANPVSSKKGNSTTVETEEGIPNAKIPAPLIKPKDIIPLGCDRPFLYRNEIYSVDPPQAQDGSSLQYFVKNEPEANSILEQYQRNRNRSKLGAYAGTLGILALALASPISKQFSPDSRDRVRGILQIAGLSLAAGGFIYSFTLLRANESLIPKAVNAHNQNHPNDPIELQFSTGWSF